MLSMVNLWILSRLFFFNSLKKNPVRYLFTIVGIVAGLSLFISLRLVNKASSEAIELNVKSLVGETHLKIKPSSGTLPESILKKIDQLEIVRYSAPIIRETTYYIHQKTSEKFKIDIMAVDLLKEGPFRNYETNDDEEIIDDPLEFINTPNAIIISDIFAKKFNLEIEDTFQLITPTGPMDFEIGGILKSKGPAKAFGGSLAIMDIMGAQNVFYKEYRMDSVDVILWDKNKISETKLKLQKILGKEIRVQDIGGEIKSITTFTSSLTSLLDFLGGFSWFIGLFLVYSCIQLSITAKLKTVAIFRALGANSTRVLFLFLLESVLLGMIATPLALIAGKLISNGVRKDIFHSMEEQFNLSLSNIDASFSINEIFCIFIAGTLTALLAATVPSLRVLTIPPVAIFRGFFETTSSSKTKTFVTYLTLALSLIMCIIFYYFKWHEISHILNLIFFTLGCLFFLLAIFPTFIIISKILIKIFLKLNFSTLWQAVKSNFHRKKSSTSTILRFLIGLQFIYFINTISDSFYISIDRWLKAMSTDNYLVSNQGELFNFRVPTFDYKTIKDLEKWPELEKGLDGSFPASRFENIHYKGEQIKINTVSTSYNEDFFFRVMAITQSSKNFTMSDFFNQNYPVIIISRNFARRFKKELGDTIKLKTSFKTTIFSIKAICQDYSHPVGTIIMAHHHFIKLFNDSTFSTAVIKFKDHIKNKQELISKLTQNIIGKKRMNLVDQKSMTDEVSKRVLASFGFIKIVDLIVILISLLALSTPLLSSLIYRFRHFGIIRSVGLSRNKLYGLIFSEILLDFLIAFLVISFIGTLFNKIFIEQTVSYIMGLDITYHFSTFILLRLFIIGISIVTISTIIIMTRLKKTTIKEMIDYE